MRESIKFDKLKKAVMAQCMKPDDKKLQEVRRLVADLVDGGYMEHADGKLVAEECHPPIIDCKQIILLINTIEKAWVF